MQEKGRKTKKALIIGGGIGGLSAALALQQAGIEVKVFERINVLQDVGAGLTLWTNAIRVLQRLGLTDVLQGIAAPYTRATIRSRHGEILSETPVRVLAEKFGVASVAVHRADFQAALLKAVGEEVVQFGTRCLGCYQDKAGVCIQLADGQQVCGDVLIGADGIHSFVRTQLFGDIQPRFAGYIAWRGVAQFTAKETAFESWGRGQRFGYVPLTQGRVYWFATRNVSQSEEAAGRKRALLTLFQGWHEPIEAAIEATEEEAILYNDISDLKSLPHWGKGCITLLGDAAHAMTPNLGQGACQAIEDALMLAWCLQHFQNTEDALCAYEQRRIKRVDTIVRQSRMIGWIGQWENPFACGIRTLLLRVTPPDILMKQLEWIIGREMSL
jgi:2-polyprenyl-6-methoxyphenol hydroxylase-like FAD-dependent oxidoreductase